MGKPGGPAGGTVFVVSTRELCSWVILLLRVDRRMGDAGGSTQTGMNEKTWACVGSERRKGRYETFL